MISDNFGLIRKPPSTGLSPIKFVRGILSVSQCEDPLTRAILALHRLSHLLGNLDDSRIENLPLTFTSDILLI